MTDTIAAARRALAERYAIERVLGEGGMAIVYLARDRKHADRAVALKVLRPEVAGALGAYQFVREIRIAAHLSHPHIVPVFDSGEADGFLYYVMPYVEGETLRARLRREGPLPASDAVRLIGQIASALSYAHGRGIAHCDVKPENVMLSGGEAVVTDFGIARALRAAGERENGTAPTFGTPGYMSPEQVVGLEGVDARADVYSLACVLYELIAGAPPRRLLSADAVRRGRLSDLAGDGGDSPPRFSASVEAALARALAPDPDSRFPTVAEFAAAVQRDTPLPATDRARSVAVLPFVNLSGDPDDGYLGDGIAEEIISALARVPSLRVAARTSSFRYREQGADVRAIGTELGVGVVLEGSVRRSGERLRVSVQLVNVADGYERWSERYERDMRDVVAIQDEIAASVAEALAVMLTDVERRALRRAGMAEPRAYEYYLRGRQYFHQSRKRSLEYAREMFDRAIATDPGFALAYAGVADCSSLLHMYYPSAQPELERADAASLRALELAPDLPEAHAARAFALSQLRRYDDAAAEFQTAIRLDPNQFEARYFFGRQCFQRGETAEAARWFEDAARVREDYQARFFAAQSYQAMGRELEARAAYRRALAAAERHLELNPDDPRAATMCAVSSCRLDHAAIGLRWARRALEIDPEDAGVRYNVACLYALEGRVDEALDCLEECFRLGFGNREWIAQDPDLASLHGHPRLTVLLAGPAPGPVAR